MRATRGRSRPPASRVNGGATAQHSRGAIGPTYTLALEDVGALLTVALIGTDALGVSEAVISEEIGPVPA